jgi:hypothetical protein
MSSGFGFEDEDDEECLTGGLFMTPDKGGLDDNRGYTEFLDMAGR